MSDFLRGLLERGVQPVEAVRPRTPAIFEPEDLRAGMRTQSPKASFEEISEAELPPRASRIRAHRNHAQIAEYSTDAAEPVTKSPERMRRPRMRTRVEAAGLESNLEEDGRAALDTAARSSEQSPIDELPGVRKPTSLEISSGDTEHDLHLPFFNQLGAASRSNMAGSERPSMSNSTDGQGSLLRDSGRQVDTGGLPAPPVPVGISEIAMRRVRERIPEKKVTEAISALEPAIHVSIGRIEVRAVPDSTGGRRTKETSPVMGLDEYLRQRSKDTVR